MEFLFSFGPTSSACCYKTAHTFIMYEASAAEIGKTLYTIVVLTFVSTAGMQTFEESFIPVKLLDYLVPAFFRFCT